MRTVVCLTEIGFSNVLFPSPWHPEHGSTRRSMRLNLSLDEGGDPLGVDSAAESVFSGAIYGSPLVAKLHASDSQTI